MRCLSIADKMQETGIDTVFVTADDCMSELLRSRGYENVILHTDYADMEKELDLLTELQEFKEASGIVTDSYFVTDKYLGTLTDKKKTAYIDDCCIDRPVNAIVNYNIYANAEAYGKETKQNLLLGPSYAPLRSIFQDITPIEIKETAKDILFLAGGSDPEHAALKFVREIKECESDFDYTIVVGSMSEDFNCIKEIACKSGKKITVLQNVQNMDEVMLSSDIAISASGSTLYELCSCGVPTISYVLADNQVQAAKNFEEKGAMLYGGDIRDNPQAWKKVLSLLKNLAKEPALRKDLSNRARFFVDGKGAIRLAKELKGILC